MPWGCAFTPGICATLEKLAAPSTATRTLPAALLPLAIGGSVPALEWAAAGLAARYPVVSGPIFTTSKSRPRTRRTAASSESLQRGSGAPLTYQSLPLSARNMP